MPIRVFLQSLLSPPPFIKQRRLPTGGFPETRAAAPSRCRLSLRALFALALPFALATLAGAQTSLTLAWDPNPESDIAGYVIYLGTTSGVYSTIEDIGNATSHTFNGLSPSTPYYCALQAYNSAGLMSDLSEEFSFTLQTTLELFNGWASTAGLGGAAAMPGAMPFHDGVRNMMKFAFNMDAAGPDTRTLVKGAGTAGLPVFTLDRSGSQPVFTVEYLRRKSSGLVYTPKCSTDLANFEPMTGTTTVTQIDSNWDRVVVQTPVSVPATPRLFGVVEVTMP